MILEQALLRRAARVLRRPWQVFRCEDCGTKIDSSQIADWKGPGSVPPGWELKIGFHSVRILCGGCAWRPKAAEPQSDERPVYAELSYITLAGDRGEVPSVCATCSRCEHATESYGTGEKSVARCMILLREECPLEQHNFYTDNPEGASTEPADDEDLDDEDGDPDEEHADVPLPRVAAAIEKIPLEDRHAALDELERAIPRIVATTWPMGNLEEDEDEIPF